MRRFTPLLFLVLLTACGGGSPTATVGAAPSEPPDTAPSQPASAARSAAPSPSPTGTTARAVYYLHDDGQGVRLYREFHPRPTTDGVIRDAVMAMLTAHPYDGDYTSLWPKGTSARGARVSGTTAFVDLSGEATRGSAGAEGESQSLQQLVYTVTAAAPAVHDVQLLVEGRQVSTLWGHTDTRRPIARGAAADVLGAVWLTVPRSLRQGGRFGGEATVFEATVSWEFRQGGRVVSSGHTDATTGAPGRGTWSATADVPPGEYVVRAYERSAKDGTATHVDDKAVTVTG